jgi:hypothetical protein
MKGDMKMERQSRNSFWKGLVIVAITLPPISHAQVSVLGFELDRSTAEQVRSALGKNTKIDDEGVNAYTGGLQFTTDGTGYQIEGLSEVSYIFDKERRLAGVVMQLDKHRFDDVFKMLAAKYKVTAERRPFVGNRFAEFKPKGATIQLSAPHMSFKMQAVYVRNDLHQAFNLKTAQEAQNKQAIERSKF